MVEDLTPQEEIEEFLKTEINQATGEIKITPKLWKSLEQYGDPIQYIRERVRAESKLIKK